MGGFRYPLGRLVAVGGVVFGSQADNGSGHQAGHDAAEPVPVIGNGEGQDSGENYQEAAGGEYAVAQGPEQPLKVGLLAAPHQESPQDGGDNAGSGQQQGEQGLGQLRPLHRKERAGPHQGNGGDDAAHIGLEQVRAHPGHIAHIVAHIVGNNAGIAGVILRNAGLDLAHQIRAHIGGFGENPAADPGKEGNGTGPKAEPGHRADVLENQVEDADPQQADADHGYAHHRAAGKGDAQGRVQAPHGGGGGADIGSYRHIHPDETGQPGANRPHYIGYGGGRRAQAVGKEGVVQHRQHDGNGDDQGQQGQILPAQKSRRPGADGVADFDHSGIAPVGPNHAIGHKSRKDKGNHPGGQGQDNQVGFHTRYLYGCWD